MAQHDTLVHLFDTYLSENEKFTHKGNKAAGTRARNALNEIAKGVKVRRKEIQESKTAAVVSDAA
jgi:hypothetical protein